MNVPKLRFKEFDEEWGNQTLDRIVERIVRKNKNLESGLPLTISADKGLVDQITYFNKNVSGKDLSGYYLLKKGEFAYNKSYSNGYPWGAIKQLENYNQGLLSTLYICFKTTNVDDVFLKHYFETTHWYKEVSMIAAEGARNHGLLNIPVNEFFKIKLSIPREREQKKIGDLFEKLNKKIQLQQQKIDLLQEQKKGFLQKMFPKAGERQPEMRLDGFMGDWEQRKLDDYFTERSERSGSGELISVTINLGVVRAADLDRRDSSSEDKSNYKVVKAGDIAYNSMRMWQGASGYSPYDGILSPAYTVIKPKEDVYTQFFAYMFKRYDMIQTFRKNSQGLTSDTWNLKFPALKRIKVDVPSYDEQVKIAEFFKQLDDTIALHQRKLDLYKEQKKGFMQQMFI
ncbi:restriction endonuclease subunit S [Bacillus cereus]|uniref:restriction endonuclease subunit S n=1 Tax=Bacillus cereus TaxID=1396 RepID=UPI003D06AD9E